MQRPTHACSAGTDAPPKENAPATDRGDKRNQHRDSRAIANVGKGFAALRAELALQGYSLSRSSAADGLVIFYVGRWGMVRKLRNLADVTAFAKQVGVRHG